MEYKIFMDSNIKSFSLSTQNLLINIIKNKNKYLKEIIDLILKL